jgi:hypothetical protein
LWLTTYSFWNDLYLTFTLLHQPPFIWGTFLLLEVNHKGHLVYPAYPPLLSKHSAFQKSCNYSALWLTTHSFWNDLYLTFTLLHQPPFIWGMFLLLEADPKGHLVCHAYSPLLSKHSALQKSCTIPLCLLFLALAGPLPQSMETV